MSVVTTMGIVDVHNRNSDPLGDKQRKRRKTSSSFKLVDESLAPPFSENELHSFDIEQLKGVCEQLGLVHASEDDKEKLFSSILSQ